MIKLKIDELQQDAIIKVSDLSIEATIQVEGVIEGGASPPYEGEYEITPKIDEQVFETKDKRMTQDLKILSIPYSEVSNPEGGLTVNIAFDE